MDCPVSRPITISGGFNIQGSVTASYRSDHDGNATDLDDNTSWTIWQTSVNDLSGTANAYCMAVSAL